MTDDEITVTAEPPVTITVSEPDPNAADPDEDLTEDDSGVEEEPEPINDPELIGLTTEQPDRIDR